MYQKATLKVITFDTEDVITTSAGSIETTIPMAVTTSNDPVITAATITVY